MEACIVESSSGVQPQNQDFEKLKFSHDVLAAEAFEQLLNLNTADRNLYICLERQKESYPSLRDFWDQASTVPPWVDWAQVRRGQLVFNRYLLPIVLGFAFQGFAGEIAAAVGPAEVLVRAGGLSSNNIKQRIAQTLQWLMEATESLASLQPGGKGHASTIQIRLLHARVRRRIVEAARLRPAYYDLDRHGTPINTHDTILTLVFFCCKPIWVQFPQLWVCPGANEIEDFVALWRYLAHLLGLPSEHFASAAIARQTMSALDQEEKMQGEASQQITNTFINAFADRAPCYLSRGFLQAGIRAMNSASTCDVLKVPEVTIMHHLTFASLKAFVAFLTLVQTKISLFDVWMQEYLRNALRTSLSNRQNAPDRSLTDFKYISACPNNKRPKMREDGRRPGFTGIKRPLEAVLMLLIVVTGLLTTAAFAAVVIYGSQLAKIPFYVD